MDRQAVGGEGGRGVTDSIIDVTVNAAGQIDYRLRTSTLSTKEYGEILATLAGLIATMMASEGGFDETTVRREILRYFADEVKAPTAQTMMSQLQ
jgi:hypothetical protein